MAIADITGTAAPGDEETPATETPASEASATETAEAPAGEKEEQFFDPSKLSDDLKGVWKRMQGTYTKKMQAIKEVREKAELVDRFQSDPTFALQTIQQVAQQMGYRLTQAQAAEVAAAAAPSAGPSAPAELVQAVRGKLSPELQWMAQSLADAQWAGMQMALKPMQDRNEADRRTQRTAQYEQLAEELNEVAPGWEEHEDAMDELLKFLQSDQLTHRKYGSKLAILHNLATGNAAATKEAVRRMGEAARSRTATGQSGRSTGSNIDERVRKAKTTREAWDEAAKHAVEDLEKHGIRIR